MITIVSAIVAILIGRIETLGLVGQELKLQGEIWDWLNMLNNNFGMLGYFIIGSFAADWLVSFIVNWAQET